MQDCFKIAPIVYCVKDSYVITVPVTRATVMWVSVDGECRYDDACGVLRSDVSLHKMTVPKALLDGAGKYTVCWRYVEERKPYFPKVSGVYCAEFEFCPASGERVNVYQIADAHGDVVNTVAAAKRFESEHGKIDLLVLNGDIVDHSGSVENFDAIHKISAEISGGRIPVVCTRGNHDLRGVCAEKLTAYIPTHNGKTYYTFRQGNVWGLVLDCAEDKNDDHAEYGFCNCCSAYRREQTEFLKSVVDNADREYAAIGVKHRIVIAHNPFTMKFPEPFNIEEELYAEWVDLLNKNVKPTLLLSGHKHYAKVVNPGDADDGYGQSFPTVIGSVKDHKTGYFAGCGLVLDREQISVVVTDREKTVSCHELNM